MGRLVVEEVLLEGVGRTPLVGGGRVKLLPLEGLEVVVLLLLLLLLLLLSRFLFGLRLDPKEAPNCLNREFMRTTSCVIDAGLGGR